MDDLARELGISKKTIYKFFGDKNDLIRSIIEMKTEMDKAICMNCTQHSENAIDELFNVSQLVVEHLTNINPTVFYDLRKYHPDAWAVMDKHKWQFVLSMIQENISRGIDEGLYRLEIRPEIIGRLYVSATEAVLDASIFQWPEFKFQQVFIEMVQFHLFGMVSEKGRKYLQQKIENENNL